ncbi:choice-of-anchor P family protein [Actinomadura atramentaria]|uniref:choice-of-anchor P family protein n=1 Tax=Actinomadura atramentaria TaxID=1990 RepID=UPI0003827A38|nr:choice-of-anchor P family protein [Actinomadura atramentaria]
MKHEHGTRRRGRTRCRTGRTGRTVRRGVGRVAAAGGAVAVAWSVCPLQPVHAAPKDLGGWTLSGSASPLSILIYDKAIPVPADPQVEINFTYAGVTMQSGSAQAVSSALWPGTTIAEGLPQLIKSDKAAWPAWARAAAPGGPAKASKDPGMAAAARDRHATAATEGGPPRDSLGTLNLGTTSVPLPDLAGMIGFRGLACSADGTVTGTSAGAAVSATMPKSSLFGGLVTIDRVTARAAASSDARHGTATGSAAYRGLKVLGQDVTISDSGDVRVGGKPFLPGDQKKTLADLGFTFQRGGVKRTVDGAHATAAATGPKIVWDTRPLRAALDGPLELLKQTMSPQDLKDLGFLFDLAPKIVIVLGNTTADATAAPPIDAGGLPGSPPSPDGAAPVSAPDAQPDVRLPQVAGGAPATAPAAAFGGLPGALVAGGVVAAFAAAWGLRRFDAAMFPGGTCASGHPVGVPDLRGRR